MKKITTQGVLEEVTYYCDKHPDRECYSELLTSSWYGSKFDLLTVELHLCDECIDNIYKMINTEFKVQPKEIEL